MKLEDQVTSLELSKRLHELGVKQESLFYWDVVFPGGPKIESYDEICEYYSVLKENYCSAFTASELLELLPHIIRLKNKNNNLLNMSKHEIYYYDIYSHDRLVRFNNETFVNLLAKMLIHLIENNLLEIK